MFDRTDTSTTKNCGHAPVISPKDAGVRLVLLEASKPARAAKEG